MRYRKLGDTGLEVSEIAFGAWQLGNARDWGAMDDRTAHGLVLAACEAGINLFDTAPNYASGQSERLLGEALVDRRNEVLLASKFGHAPDGSADFSVGGFRKSLEASLHRLRTDRLDVLLLHNPPPEMCEGDDPLWEALDAARQQGLVRHFGASLDDARGLKACLANTRSDVFEIRFNVFHQSVRSAFPNLRARGAGAIVKTPLDSGWLTGRFDANSRFDGIRSRWTAEDIARRAKLVAELDWLTADGTPLSHAALGYALSYGEVSCVIPGVRTPDQLESNVRAAGGRLTDAERAWLEAFWQDFTADGERPLPW